MTNIPDRNIRQRDIIPPDRLAACKGTVIGVGAIGRQVALQLAAMGISWLQLIDHDVVEPANLACQGYLEDDLGLPKVEATETLAQRLNSQMEVYPLHDRFRRSHEIGNVLFVCVDKIETRQLIWEAAKDRVVFFADGRMSAEAVRVLVASDPATRRHYPTTLFTAGEAFTGTCTAKSTIFTANVAAGLMLEQFARHLRGMPIDADLQFNLLSSELLVANP